MKSAVLTTVLSLVLAIGVSALDKPLNIDVTFSSDCPEDQKTKKGWWRYALNRTNRSH